MKTYDSLTIDLDLGIATSNNRDAAVGIQTANVSTLVEAAWLDGVGIRKVRDPGWVFDECGDSLLRLFQVSPSKQRSFD